MFQTFLSRVQPPSLIHKDLA